jgi:hypothetical protein
VFQAAYWLRDRGLIALVEQERHDRILRWFSNRLPVPTRFARSRRRNAHANAICWFRAEATEHITTVRQLAEMLERHGITTRAIQTTKPGYVVYEDDFQVVAVPFRDTEV